MATEYKGPYTIVHIMSLLDQHDIGFWLHRHSTKNNYGGKPFFSCEMNYQGDGVKFETKNDSDHDSTAWEAINDAWMKMERHGLNGERIVPMLPPPEDVIDVEEANDGSFMTK